jgi:hypothetical protein
VTAAVIAVRVLFFEVDQTYEVLRAYDVVRRMRRG